MPYFSPQQTPYLCNLMPIKRHYGFWQTPSSSEAALSFRASRRAYGVCQNMLLTQDNRQATAHRSTSAVTETP